MSVPMFHGRGTQGARVLEPQARVRSLIPPTPTPTPARPTTGPTRVGNQCSGGSFECFPTTAPACAHLGLDEDPQGLGCSPAWLSRPVLSPSPILAAWSLMTCFHFIFSCNYHPPRCPHPSACGLSIPLWSMLASWDLPGKEGRVGALGPAPQQNRARQLLGQGCQGRV